MCWSDDRFAQTVITADTDPGQTSPAGVSGTDASAQATSRGHKLAQVWTKIAPEPVTVTITLSPDARRTLRVAEDTR